MVSRMPCAWLKMTEFCTTSFMVMQMKKDSLGAKKQRNVKQHDDLSLLSMPVEEVRMRLRRHTGAKFTLLPKSGEGKSTTIRVMDIALLARVDPFKLYKFSGGKFRFGLKRMERIIDILRQVDAGLITKAQQGVYHFHDEPVAKPVREMRVSLDTGRLMQGMKVSTYQKMPSFKNILGGK